MGLIANDLLDFPGIWHYRYWFPNTKRNNVEEMCEFQVRIERHDIHSLADTGEASGSHMEARFTVDGNVATGTFMEDTSPTGDWEGMTYKGAFQLLLSEDHLRMEGMRVVAGYNNGHPKIFPGRVELFAADN
jgi:hypothetical protein